MVTISTELLKAIAPDARLDIIAPVGVALTMYFPVFKITTLYRVAHFLAQAAHESDGFQTLEEYASGKAYEGRQDLGNTHPGDGVRYKGRGIFQLTGLDNYSRMGRRLGIELVTSPELAAGAEVSSHIACLYWQDKKLNTYADADDIRSITKRINGGYNGLKDRQHYLNRAKLALQEMN